MASSFRSAPVFQLSEPRGGGVQRREKARLMYYTKSCVELIKTPIWSITAEWKFSLVLIITRRWNQTYVNKGRKHWPKSPPEEYLGGP